MQKHITHMSCEENYPETTMIYSRTSQLYKKNIIVLMFLIGIQIFQEEYVRVNVYIKSERTGVI